MRRLEGSLPSTVWYSTLVLVAVVVALVAFTRLAERRVDPDTFWHIETGRWIVGHGRIPSVDELSWYGAERGATWTAHEWLFGLFVYGVRSLGGYRLLFAVTAASHATLFLLVYALAVTRSRQRLLSLVIAGAAAIGTFANLAPRPQMLTFCLLLTIALLGEKRRLWWAVPLVIVGVNIHGAAFMIYLVVVAFYAIPDRLPVLAACTAATLVNPFGAGLFRYTFGIGNPDLPYLAEFARTAPATQPLYAGAMLVLLLLLWRRRLEPRDAVMLLALVALSLTAVRQIALFWILVLPLAATYLPEIETPAPAPPVPASGPRRALLWMPVAALSLALVLPASRALGARIDVTREYPAAAAAYVRAQRLDRVWNVWQDGGFLMSAGVQPMVDGRGDPFMSRDNHGVDLAHDYFRTWYLEDDPAPFFDRYGIRHLVITKDSPLYRALRRQPDMESLYEDDAYAVLRHDAATASTAP